MKKLLIGFVIVSASLSGAAGSVAAQAAEPASGHRHADSGYQYTFDDDPLAAGLLGANEVRIVVRERAARVTLIRPRTHFVSEMLKSVENL